MQERNFGQPNDQTPKEEDIAAIQNLSVNLIRAKLDVLYANEPDVLVEEQEVKSSGHLSQHQKFMYDLMHSGKGLAQIQTEWHNYYQKLSNEEKKQVWNEFYASNQNPLNRNAAEPTATPTQAPPKVSAQDYSAHINSRGTNRSRSSRYASTRRKTPTPAPRLTWKHHLQSALFGLAMGVLVIIILLFGFFNEVIIAPFIQPSRTDTATPIILSSQTVAPSTTPEVIIPKINVEIPVDYNVHTTNENVIENDLEGGVIHYPTTSLPGETGNAAFFGHSSNNILNPGKYKFAFVLLHDLVKGDVFYLTYADKIYAYKVFLTKIVSPNDVSVLNPLAGHVATATLITCDPPGTSLNRLIVVGDQINPSPTGDTAPTPTISASTNVTQLPSNGPTLWQRYISTLWGKIVTGVIVLGVIYFIWRWYNREFTALRRQ
jgi:sortase A